MIEPTETESKERLDHFAEAVRAILEEAKEDPEVARTAPHTTPVRRLDEAGAAKRPVVRWRPGAEGRCRVEHPSRMDSIVGSRSPGSRSACLCLPCPRTQASVSSVPSA